MLPEVSKEGAWRTQEAQELLNSRLPVRWAVRCLRGISPKATAPGLDDPQFPRCGWELHLHDDQEVQGVSVPGADGEIERRLVRKTAAYLNPAFA